MLSVRAGTEHFFETAAVRGAELVVVFVVTVSQCIESWAAIHAAATWLEFFPDSELNVEISLLRDYLTTGLEDIYGLLPAAKNARRTIIFSASVLRVQVTTQIGQSRDGRGWHGLASIRSLFGNMSFRLTIHLLFLIYLVIN